MGVNGNEATTIIGANMVNNQQFLYAIFSDKYTQSHVASFLHDPNNIPKNEHMKAWCGGNYNRYTLTPGNQYFTISLFDNGRRRKVDYIATYCIVLDDVREKLPIEQANKLPKPSWILETSAGSEQWGYILSEPCHDRYKVENLLDGLVENGLAPGGKDPGMKGVTRYVRLPEGINNKASKLVNGKPYSCTMLVWEPDRQCTLEDIGDPFFVDLNKERRDTRVDGAGKMPDHPLLDEGLLNIKEVRSDGRFDVTCPWVDEHTGAVDDGAAVFTNFDGSLGFKCHHGACDHRTGYHLIQAMDTRRAGWAERYNTWQAMLQFDDIEQVNSIKDVIDNLMLAEPRSKEQLSYCKAAVGLLASVEDSVERSLYDKDIRTAMRMNASDFNKLKVDVVKETKKTESFYDDVIFVAEQNQFLNRKKRIWYKPDAYKNTYSHLNPEVLKEALAGDRVAKVDKVDYAPKMPPIYIEDGITYGNGWHRDSEREGKEGDCTAWLNHFDKIGWGGKWRDHMLKWMAHTIRFPEIKINHALILGSAEGVGKDWLLYPLIQAMGCNHKSITTDDLLGGFNEFILSTKHLHINELEIDDEKQASIAALRLKPLCAAPPDKLRTHDKGTKKVEVRNIINVSATTNSRRPLKLKGQSRRLFALWSDVDVRDCGGEMTTEWREYWREMWPWMTDEGVDACIHYLRHEVDLTNFYPAEAPPVTKFLRDITLASNNLEFPTNVSFM